MSLKYCSKSVQIEQGYFVSGTRSDHGTKFENGEF